jgi:hypothetical protein
MSSKAEHCQDCIDEIGQPFEEVHVWLDEFFPIVGPEHRLIRHHRMGIERQEAYGVMMVQGRLKYIY